MNEETPSVLNESVIRNFWHERASDPDNRWTSDDMLAFELSFLEPLIGPNDHILDLGAGHGRLSRQLAGNRSLTAVDWEPTFAAAFTGPEQEFVESRVQDYRPSRRYPIVLLFGVVTYLEEKDESAVYDLLSRATDQSGVAVVKNQVGRHDEVVVGGHSDRLGQPYSGRYPARDSQEQALRERFADVSVVEYPEVFNPWPDTEHIAFVCRRPRT